MKHVFLLLFSIALIQANAQQTPNDTSLADNLKIAWKNISGPIAQRNTAKAYEIFTQCANAGNAEAMNALGVMNKRGMGMPQNHENAIEWFTKAANAGYSKAWYNLAMAYKEVLDFENAFKYYCKSADSNDPQGVYGKAYMLYKGFGCQQDYQQAAILFAQGAYLHKPNSMYFYGLCLRNGYGIAENKDSANYWLTQSASKGYNMALDELRIKEPENTDLAGNLADKIKAAQAVMHKEKIINKYKKIENKVAASDIEGTYSGYLLKYDWSGQKIIETNKVNIVLNYDSKSDSLKGTWLEDDTISISINAKLTPQALVFDNMKYMKYNHYSIKSPELTIFNKAYLQLDKSTEAVYLSGNIEQFIPKRKEPSKPLYLALLRTKSGFNNQDKWINNEDVEPLIAYPNPFGNTITIDFKIKETCNVYTQIFTHDGKLVYSNSAGILAAGNYTLPIQTQQISSGYFTIVLHYGSKIRTSKIIKL